MLQFAQISAMMHWIPPDILSLSFYIVPQEQDTSADKQTWLCSLSTWCDSSPANVCGSRWTVLPWEINSIGVNKGDWDGHCEVRVGLGGDAYVCSCVNTHNCIFTMWLCVFLHPNPSGLIIMQGIDNWGISMKWLGFVLRTKNMHCVCVVCIFWTNG